MRERINRWLRLGAAGLFWSWHAVYLALLAFGLVPYALVPLLESWIAGRSPLGFVLTVCALCLLPVGSAWLGWRWRADPGRLFRLFYGALGPLVALLFFRLIFLREVGGAAAWMLAWAGAGGVYYAASLARPLAAGASASARGARLVGGAALLGVGLWAGLMMSFYALPLVGTIAQAGWQIAGELLHFDWIMPLLEGLGELLRELWAEGPRVIWFFFLGSLVGLTFAYTMTLAAGLPLAMTALYIDAWRRAFRSFAGAAGASAALAVTGAVLAAGGLGFGAVSEQPQARAFELLEAPPADDDARRALLAQEAEIREGLTNAYLASWRYIGATADARHIESIWRESLGVREATWLSDLYAWAARPLLYDGEDMSADRERARAAYAAFFDASIQELERQAVLDALRATYDTAQVEAGLLDAGERVVRLARQDVSVDSAGDLAEVTVHEVYANQTLDRQEIYYTFSLPRSAAVTGLWLGESPDRGEAFAYTVAPRGAAQEVYRAERARRVDPALLEQVGPQQYRLRAFPIPAKPSRYEEAAPMHLWLTYATPARGGAWPTPALLEARNIYWDEDTERTLGGAPAPPTEGWFAPLIEADAAAPRAHVADLGDGLWVHAEPVADERRAPAAGRRMAVALDRSYSMASRAGEVADALRFLREHVAPQSEVDLYLMSAPARGAAPERVDLAGFDASGAVWFGGQDLYGLIEDAHAASRGAGPYDLMIVLTDGGGDRLATDREPFEVGAPLWLVHLGGDMPAVYDDATLEMVQASGGGVAATAQEAQRRDALVAASSRPGVIDVADGYVWSLLPGAPAAASEPAFASLGARQLVNLMTREMNTGRLEDLDALHAVAARHHVVTAWSSMIVLVDERQREALRRASEAADRFEREVETGEEEIAGAEGLKSLTATPEPEEWALILAALCVAAAGARRREFASS